MELIEKIQPFHKETYQRMLGIQELPNFLLEEYFKVKKLIDKVDGTLTPFDLVQIAIRCGFDVETMKFRQCKPDFFTEPRKNPFESPFKAEIADGGIVVEKPHIDPEFQAKINNIGVETLKPSQVIITPDVCSSSGSTPTDEATSPAPEPIKELVEDIPEPRYTLGTTCDIFENNQILHGSIVGTEKTAEGDYQVECEDGETYNVSEDDIEV